MLINVLFTREPANDAEAAYASNDRAKKQLALELNDCYELEGTFVIDPQDNEGRQFLVIFEFEADVPDDEARELLLVLLQYGFARYGWGGSFEMHDPVSATLRTFMLPPIERQRQFRA